MWKVDIISQDGTLHNLFTENEYISDRKIEGLLSYIQSMGYYVDYATDPISGFQMFNIGERRGDKIYYIASIGEFIP